MEWRRLLSRKVLLAGILLYLFQATFFIGNQMNHTGFSEFIRQNRQYRQTVETFKKQQETDGLTAVKENLGRGSSEVERVLADKLDYLIGYEDSIERILASAENAQQFSVFQDPNSYSYVNTIKTARDFERMKGVSLRLDQDRVTQQVLSFSALSFFAVVFVMYVIYEILRERDNGMWENTHVMKNGRCHLAAGRGVGLLIVTAAFYLLCLLTDLLIAGFLYGLDDFGGYIQTVAAYARYPLPVSKLAYLGLYAVKNIFALSCIVMLVYLVFTMFRSRNLTVVLLLGVFAGEWYLMRHIPVYSNRKLLRYVNLMQLFDSAALDREYQNLNVFGRAVGASTVLLLTEAFLLAVCFGLAVWIYGRQYPGKTARFEQWIAPVRRTWQKILERLSFDLQEAYKILGARRGLLFILFGALLCLWIYDRTLVTFPEMQQKMDTVYANYGGEDWTGFNAYVSKLERDYERIDQRIQTMREQMREGILRPEREVDISVLQRQANAIRIYLDEYQEKQKMHEWLRRKKGIESYAMSDRGYYEILGPNGIPREIVMGLVLLVLSVLLAAQTFWFESRSHTRPLLKCSERGIAWVFQRKLRCVLLIDVCLLVLFYGVDYGLLLYRYRMPYLSAPIQSLTFYAQNTARITVGQMLLLQTAFKGILPLGAAASTLWISSGRRVVNQMYVPVLIVAYAAAYVLILLFGPVWLLLLSVAVGLVSIGLCVAGAYKKWCA